MDQEIIDYINKAAQPGTADYQLAVLDAAVTDGATLQIDRPLVRVIRPDGIQIATLHVPTAEFALVVPQRK